MRATALVGLLGGAAACADVRGADAESPTSSWREEAALGDPAFGNATARGADRRLANADAPPTAERSDASPSAGPFSYQAPVLARGKDAPGSRYAGLSDGACRKEVKRRALPVDEKTKGASGVASPMRLGGPLHGVRFVTPGPSSPFGVVDCRMVLALDDLGAALAASDVVTVRIDNFYRAHAHLPGKKTESQHALALAADITSFSLRDGRTLSIDKDWHAPIGSVSCGPEAVLDDSTDEAVALRNLVCGVARRGLFHHMLTPSFNAAHRTHLHFDIKRGDTFQTVR